MAKTPKSAKSDRQAVIDDIRRKQKGAEKRRGLAIVGVCAAVALIIIGAAAYRPVMNWWDKRGYSDTPLAEIGSAASVCQDITTQPAEGSNDHVDESQQVTYDFAPPAFGPHWNVANLAPDPMDRKFYTADDRPELEALVHNSEHGYNIIWYDETVAEDDDQLAELRAIADKFTGTANFRDKVKVVPWTKDDAEETSGKWPEGQHVAFTHWSVGGSGETDAAKQVGVWQYCSEVSGEAFEKFTVDYPYTDSPEPNAM
ncbi:DUF3105 domain-containing protein [Nocardioides pantholopis]|uniref:DUF3105 domain-containing protein n=1 Tax=Nocardioides pantholopis TaxID=2483798 RepID=UPI000F0825C2|nr:DUF3105 domain-containing protein [Nocardioides pantholopis]